jgi:hypothetical protein
LDGWQNGLKKFIVKCFKSKYKNPLIKEKEKGCQKLMPIVLLWLYKEKKAKINR